MFLEKNTMDANTDTDNPFYTDTRYICRIRYDDNLTVTKPLLKFVFDILKKHMF